MSVKITALCWKVSLPHVEKHVLMRLADFADDSGRSIYPAVATVAEDCGLSVRAVQIAIRKLLNLGILIRLSLGGGRARTSGYAIDLTVLRQRRKNSEQDSVFSGNGADHAIINPASDSLNSVRGMNGNPESHAQNPASDSSDPSESVSKEAVLPARAHACEAIRIIEAFDAERIAVFGPAQGRDCEDVTDREYAERWLSAGADVPLCQRVIAALMRRMHAQQRGPIRKLRYCDEAIFEALAVRTSPAPEGKSNVEYLRNARSQGPRGAFAYFIKHAADGD